MVRKILSGVQDVGVTINTVTGGFAAGDFVLARQRNIPELHFSFMNNNSESLGVGKKVP
jgi:hypothetical protein